METICLQCGDKGYDNAFVFCVKCVTFAVHRYCLDVLPEDFDEFVHWVCDDCVAEQQNLTVSTQKNFKNDGTLPIETKEHVYEDFPQHLYDPCSKFDLVERSKAFNERSFEAFRGSNDEQNEKIEQNSQQLEHGEDRYNKTQQENLSNLIPLTANMKRKRSKIRKSTKKDYNNSKKPFVECGNIDHHKPIKSASGDLIACEVKGQKISEPGMMMEDGVICTSIGHKENGGLEFGKELPKDINVLECFSHAEPIITPIWSGSFIMSGKRHDILDGLKGHVSSKACHKVYKEISLFQQNLHLKMLPHSNVWPKRFELSDPNEEDIALFFFPSEISVPAYDQLIDEMRDKDLALKGVIQNAEILIFTSVVLPLLYWRFNDKYYLWGVFRAKQPPSNGS